MRDHDRVIVHIDHPNLGAGLASDLVHGTLRGETHADVEELADTGFGRQEPDNPAQEAPVLQRRPAQCVRSTVPSSSANRPAGVTRSRSADRRMLSPE